MSGGGVYVRVSKCITGQPIISLVDTFKKIVLSDGFEKASNPWVHGERLRANTLWTLKLHVTAVQS
jgi:hypothetical protein